MESFKIQFSLRHPGRSEIPVHGYGKAQNKAGYHPPLQDGLGNENLYGDEQPAHGHDLARPQCDGSFILLILVAPQLFR